MGLVPENDENNAFMESRPFHPPVENNHPSANPIDLTLRDISLDEAS